MKDGTAISCVEEGGDAGGLRARRAAGDGERKAALNGIEMSILCKGELELVSERRARAWIVQGSGGILFAGFLKLSALGQRMVRACI